VANYNPGLSRAANIANQFTLNPSNFTVVPGTQGTLGFVSSTIGSSRNISMSLHLIF